MVALIMEIIMFWKVLARASKIFAAVAAVAFGGWVMASEAFGPLVTDAVTNARLIELTAPADGHISPLVDEGDRFVPGQELAEIITLAPLTTGAIHHPVSGSVGHSASGIQPTVAANPMLIAEVNGLIWDWKGPGGAFYQSGDSVGDVADCTSIVAVSQAASSSVSEVQIGDPVRFIGHDVQWNGTVQRLIAGAPNLSGRYAIQFPHAAPDTYLIFVALNVDVQTAEYCAVGLTGHLHYKQDTTQTINQVSASTWESVEIFLDKVRDFTKAAAGNVLPKGWSSWT